MLNYMVIAVIGVILSSTLGWIGVVLSGIIGATIGYYEPFGRV